MTLYKATIERSHAPLQPTRSSVSGCIVGHIAGRGRFVPVDLRGVVVGNYATLNDAREALLTQRRSQTRNVERCSSYGKFPFGSAAEHSQETFGLEFH